MPYGDTDDPDYRRLRYIRYADDFLLGFAGPMDEADEIKTRLGKFLQDNLKLELSDAKTLVTHGRTQAARFLGYEVNVQHNDTKIDANGLRSVNGNIGCVSHRTLYARNAPHTCAVANQSIGQNGFTTRLTAS